MKKLVYTWLFLLLPLFCQAALPEEKVRNAVAQQMDMYPRSTLKDIYKSLFQDHFGPGHLASDSLAAKAYLLKELDSYEKCIGPMYEPTGYVGRFYRVNLSVIKQGLVPFDVFYRAFLESTFSETNPSVDQWHAQWKEILAIIDSMNLYLPQYTEDREELERNLSAGQYVGHHSAQFEKLYDPHYRLIRTDIFERIIAPCLPTQ